MGSSVTDPSLRFLQLVADRHRWRLLQELGRSDRRVGELTELLGEPQSLVSYHLGELRNGGLVAARRSSADGRDTYYRADLARFRALMTAAACAVHPGMVLGSEPSSTSTNRLRGTPRVLFLCTGNSARSQMAEALLQHRSAGSIRADSAGSHPKALHPLAVKVMAERGIDIAGRSPKHVRRFTRVRLDRVITLCDVVKEVRPEFLGRPEVAHWSMPDPAVAGDAEAERHAAFRSTARELEERIEVLVADLAHVHPKENHHAH